MRTERNSSGFLGHAATYAVGTIARRVVGFVMLPIYTRFLSPADYGAIGLLTFSLAFFEPLFGARLIHAVPKFYFDAVDRQGRRAVIWSALGLTCVVSLMSMTGLVLFRAAGSQILFGSHKYALALGVFAGNLVSLPIENAGMMYLRLRQSSRLFLAVSMGKLALQVGLNLLLVVHLRDGVLGVVLSSVASSVAVGTVLMLYTAVHEAPIFDWVLARRMVQYCWPLWLSGIAGLYIGSSGAMYLRVFDTLTDVGLLELGLRFATAVSLLVWTPFLQQWEPMSYRYYKEENGRWKFRVAFISSAAMMFAVGLGVSIFAQPVISAMAAKSFYGAAEVIPILTLGFIANNLMSFFNFSFLATGNTRISSACLYVIACFMTITYFALVPRFGLVGAAVAQCLAFIVGTVYVGRLSRRYFDPEFDVGSVVVFALICIAASVSADVLFRTQGMGIDLLFKSLVFLSAVGLMALIAIRAIRATNIAALDGLPWPLHLLRHG